MPFLFSFSFYFLLIISLLFSYFFWRPYLLWILPTGAHCPLDRDPHASSPPEIPAGGASASTGGHRRGLHLLLPAGSPPPPPRRTARLRMRRLAAGRRRSGCAIPTGSLLIPAPAALSPRRCGFSFPTGGSRRTPTAGARPTCPRAGTASPRPLQLRYAPSSFPCQRRGLLPPVPPSSSLRPPSSRSCRSRWAPPGGEDRRHQADPGGATLLWLRPNEMAPESAFRWASASDFAGLQLQSRGETPI
jgi:hypothetical protein